MAMNDWIGIGKKPKLYTVFELYLLRGRSLVKSRWLAGFLIKLYPPASSVTYFMDGFLKVFTQQIWKHFILIPVHRKNLKYHQNATKIWRNKYETLVGL